MLSLEAAHDAGLTLTSVGPSLILSGGSDGVIRLLSRRPRRASSTVLLWSRHCHDSAVTAVCLCEELRLGFSSGRDGKVILHEHIVDDIVPRDGPEGEEEGEDDDEAPPPTKGLQEKEGNGKRMAPPTSTMAISRAICRLTGEVRCLWFDPPRHRLFVGGDSLRCLHLHQKPFSITAIPLIVPHPLLAIAGNDAGTLLAMVSAASSTSPGGPPTGYAEEAASKEEKKASVGVVSVHPDFLAYRPPPSSSSDPTSSTAAPQTTTTILSTSRSASFYAAHRAVQRSFPVPFSAAMVREECTAYRLCWASVPSGATGKGGAAETSIHDGPTPPPLSADDEGKRVSSASHGFGSPELLLVPGPTAVQLYRFEPATAYPFLGHRVRHVGALAGGLASPPPPRRTRTLRHTCTPCRHVVFSVWWPHPMWYARSKWIQRICKPPFSPHKVTTPSGRCSPINRAKKMESENESPCLPPHDRWFRTIPLSVLLRGQPLR